MTSKSYNNNNNYHYKTEMATLLYSQFNSEIEFCSDIPGTRERLIIQ